MNILKIYPHPDLKAGSERAMHVTAQSLRERGHRVYLLHGMATDSETGRNYDGALGLPVLFDTRSKLTPKGLSNAEEQVDRFIAEHKIDLLHIHSYPRSSTLQRLAERYAVVTTVHVPLCPNGARYLWAERRPCNRDIGLGCLTTGYRSKGCGHLGNQLPMGLPGFIRGMVEDHILRTAIACCARVLAPSQWMAERLAQDGIPTSIIRVVHNGFVDSETASYKLPVSHQANASQPPAIAFVGRLVDFKGPDHLLQASASIKSPHRIWFVGDGPMRVELEALTAKLQLNDRVTFFGSLAPHEIDRIRLQSAVVVVPSLWQDNFPNVGPEAMMLQRPVVAYNVGGISEWLDDGVTGHLIEVGNFDKMAQAIEHLLQNPSKAHEMGQVGRKVAQQWSQTNHVTQLINAYEEAVDDKATVGSKILSSTVDSGF